MAGGFDAFHALDSEKKERILNAAFEEFAANGYAKASTNTIAEKASIGKGMLFYYFSSKEELFEFLIDYSLEVAKSFFLPLTEDDDGDFVERYKRVLKAKQTFFGRSKHMVSFIESMYKPNNKQYFEKYYAQMREIGDMITRDIYDEIDHSLLRDDIDHKNIVRYIGWLFEGYQKDIERKLDSGAFSASNPSEVEEQWREFDSFIEDTKWLFYK